MSIRPTFTLALFAIVEACSANCDWHLLCCFASFCETAAAVKSFPRKTSVKVDVENNDGCPSTPLGRCLFF